MSSVLLVVECPFAEGRLAIELSIVAGTEREGTSGVVSSTSSSNDRRS